MKDRKLHAKTEPTALVLLLPNEDHRAYTEARRLLRRLMGRKTPTIETLVLHDLRGRDSDGIADNYLDAINWPLHLGRSISVRLQEQVKRGHRHGKRMPGRLLKLAQPPTDPIRN